MLKNTYIFSAIIVVLLAMFTLTGLVKHPHPNEIRTADFHGFFVYDPVLKNTTKLDADDLKTKIFEFESNAYKFINKQLSNKVDCRDKILGRFSQYKRYYRVDSRPSKLLFSTTFTHEGFYERWGSSIEEEIMLQDGNIQQFHLAYNVNEKQFTMFIVNGPECFTYFKNKF